MVKKPADSPRFTIYISTHMNLTTYIFGNLGSGYSQYPDDYTKTIFSNMQKGAKATTQICVHRENDVMYYGYIRQLEDNDYLGICAVINGVAITHLDRLFETFETIISMMVRNGYLIHFGDNGELTGNAGRLYESKEQIDLITNTLQAYFDGLEGSARRLSAVQFGVAHNTIRAFSIKDDDKNDIVSSTLSNGYTFIYKSTGYNTAQMNSYKGIVARKSREIEMLRDETYTLKNQVAKLKNKQRNTLWVSVFAICALILGVVVWNKVLFPSEVTKKDMGEYLYYGPIEGGEPNGTGVAIYHDNDSVGRLYYYGNFTNGKRIDKKAIMFYKDGSYFKGEMNEDKWVQGLFFDVENEHFIGTFQNNAPWNGTWYEHKKVQNVVNGK